MKKYLINILLFFPFISYAGINYYVSNVGLNSNNGLSIAAPFKTITYAVTVANHGDTINVVAGTYQNTSYGTWNVWKTEQTVKINNKTSGSGNYLVIRPYNNAAVKIKGDGDYIFQIRNSSFIHVEGFEIEGEVNIIPIDTALKYQFVYRQCLNSNCTSYFDTFRVAYGTPPAIIDTMTFLPLSNILNPTTINNIGLLVQNSHHINIIKNNIHHNTGTGLRVFQSDYINVFENEIHNNSRRSSVGNHGLVFHSSTSIDTISGYKIVISRNHVHDNFNEVFSWSPLKTFITPHIDEGKGISMQKNTVANGWVNGKMKIENNISHHNGFSGIHINEGIRIDVINNTVYNNSVSYDGSGNNFGISVQLGQDIGFYNNISVANTAGNAMSASNTTNLNVSNNLIQGNIDSDVDAVDVNTKFVSPLFIDTIQFKLQPTSEAINTSLNIYAPQIDYLGQVRDTNPDRGAVEFNSMFLPITLLTFNLQVADRNKIKLNWQTASEIDNDYFIVEKSNDAIRWELFEKIQAAGNSNTKQTYTAIDNDPFFGFNYYRLKQVDFNGNFTYSNILFTKINQDNIVIYPNPTTDKIYIKGSIFENIKMYSPDGKDVTNYLSKTVSEDITIINMQALHYGIYFLVLDDKVTKIIKNHF